MRKQLTRVEVQIERIVTAITDSDQPLKALTDRLGPLDVQRAGLAEQLRLLESEKNVVSLHPNVIEAYHANVTKLADALASDALTPAVRAAFRNLIDCIVVHKTERWQPYEFTPYGRLGAILGVDLFPSVRSTDQIIAEEGATACQETQCFLDRTDGSASTTCARSATARGCARWASTRPTGPASR